MTPITATQSFHISLFIDEREMHSKVTKVALKALDVARAGAILLTKAIALPIELTLLAAVITATALSILLSLPLQWTAKDKSNIKPFHHMAAIVDNLWEIVKITYHFGLYSAEEALQNCDDLDKSPQFAKVSPSNGANKRAILYAPGYLDSPISLREDARKIANATGSSVYIVSYRSLFQGIEEHAKDVARVYNRIVNDTQTSEVILMGHSMGGLSTGRFIQNSTANVKLWITLGTPLKGTPVAQIGYGQCARDMEPGSQFIKDFNSPSRRDTIPSLHIHSLTDTVVPSEYAQSSSNNYQCQGSYSHIGLRSKGEVLDRITAAITTA